MHDEITRRVPMRATTATVNSRLSARAQPTRRSERKSVRCEGGRTEAAKEDEQRPGSGGGLTDGKADGLALVEMLCDAARGE